MKKLLKFSGFLAVLVGTVMIIGGAWGVWFTYQNVTQENIITPADASIPEAQVKGPFTLRAQSDIIREHTLNMTGGLTYAEMPRMIPVTDADGEPVINENGEPVMEANRSRDIWVTATALTVALNLAIVTYAFSGLIILFGLISVWTGIIFFSLAGKSRYL